MVCERRYIHNIKMVAPLVILNYNSFPHSKGC